MPFNARDFFKERRVKADISFKKFKFEEDENLSSRDQTIKKKQLNFILPTRNNRFVANL